MSELHHIVCITALAIWLTAKEAQGSCVHCDSLRTSCDALTTWERVWNWNVSLC